MLAVLLLTDIWIAISLLNDSRMLAAFTTRWRLSTTILCFVLFCSIPALKGNPRLPMDGHPVVVLLLALGLICVPRIYSYSPPQSGTSVPNSLNR